MRFGAFKCVLMCHSKGNGFRNPAVQGLLISQCKIKTFQLVHSLFLKIRWTRPIINYRSTANSACSHVVNDTNNKTDPLLQPRRFPEDTNRCSNVRLMLGQRRRRWPNIKTTLVQRLVSAWTGRLTRGRVCQP